MVDKILLGRGLKKALSNISANDPKMRSLNETLLIPEIQALFFKVCNYPVDTRIPKFRASENILAGVLSDIIHLHAFEAVVYASDTNIEHKNFYKILSNHFGTVDIEYDSISAVSVENELEKDLGIR